MLLWIKALHVVFMVTWFAGLFYLPRLFVYHTQVAATGPEHERMCTMERKLYAIMTVGMVLTWAFGIWLLTLLPGYMAQGWMHAKLALVVALSGYHGWLKLHLRRFAAGTNTRNHVFWRWANEAPVLALFGAVILVIVKPF
ncbi:CopD family protein [Panacagrimonas sp.]|uniref:CopD family protein n=1 Tax=Panacagrimonas sp. TaxID=2480088 RepID=UPI003B522AFA